MKAYIYAPLPKSVHKFFPKDRGGDDESVPHCTVLYVGKISKANVETLRLVLREETIGHKPIKCAFGEIKSFPAGPYGVPWYVSIDADPSLERLHRRIWDRLKDKGIPVEHQWDEYIPHATLKYMPEGTEYDGDPPVGDFTIDSIELDIAE
jgi:2'-5' RNA ligase